MEDNPPPASPSSTLSREKTTPFLIRAFIKIGGFHRLSQFEDGSLISSPSASSENLPSPDEQQIFTWKDATLREILTTLRSTAPQTPEYRHPLARYSFRSVYFDSHAAASSRREGGRGGNFASKDLGIVYSRDILGDPGSIATGIAPRLLEEYEPDVAGTLEGASTSGNKTLGELKFVPGDYLCVAVLLPKNVTVTVGPGGELAVKNIAAAGGGATAVAAAAPNGWKSAGPRGGDGGWGGSVSTFTPGSSRGGGHWRGESNGPSLLARGRGGGRRDRDDDLRRVPPPRRDSPPLRRSGRGGGGGRRRSRSSRSRSPPRRNPRYD